MKNSTQVSDVVRYPIYVLTFSGCLCVVKNFKEIWQTIQSSKNKRICVVCVFILAAIIHVANFVKSIAFVIHVMSNFHNIISFFIQAYIYSMFGTICYFCESLTCHLYFGAVMESLHDYGTQFGFCKELESVRKLSLFATVLLSLTIAFTPIISSALTIGEGLTYLMFPFDPSSVALVCLSAFTFVVVLTPCVVLMVLYTVLTEIVVREFYDCSDEMSRVMKQVKEMKLLEQEFIKIRSRHESLCQIVSKLSKLLRLNACVGLLLNLIIVFFALYALGSEELSTTYISLEVVYLIWFIVPVVIVCVVWGRLPSAAHSIIDSFSMVPKEGVPQDLLLQMQLFVFICSSRRVGIDVFGLFTLDSTTLVMVMGTVVTYGIVVIQFQQDKEKSVLCRFPSNSSVH